MKINVHAGHNPAGMVACGASGIINESTENRRVKNALIKILKEQGHEVYDCTCDNGTGQGDVLQKIVQKCNAHAVQLDVSIHFNAGGGHGTEVLVYDTSNYSPVDYAKRICESISQLGFRNRGVKVRPDLYVLSRTASPALLIECCFVDSEEDCARYDAVDMASAIAKGITGIAPEEKQNIETDKIYRVQVGAFHNRSYAESLKDKVNGFLEKEYPNDDKMRAFIKDE